MNFRASVCMISINQVNRLKRRNEIVLLGFKMTQHKVKYTETENKPDLSIRVKLDLKLFMLERSHW